MPWYDTQNKTETIIPGEQSVVFPGAPEGWLVPGDPGVPSTLAPTKYNAFSPRLGLAYTPSISDGILAKLTGDPGKTSIRTGFGIYYTAVEDLSQFLEVGDPPYGIFWVSSAPPFLSSSRGRLGGNRVGHQSVSFCAAIDKRLRPKSQHHISLGRRGAHFQRLCLLSQE